MGALLAAAAGWEDLGVLLAGLSAQAQAGASPELFPLLEVLFACMLPHVPPALCPLHVQLPSILKRKHARQRGCMLWPFMHACSPCIPATCMREAAWVCMRQVPQLSAAKARALYAAGIRDAEDLASAEQGAVERALAAALPRALQTRWRPPTRGEPRDARAEAARTGLTGQAGSNALVRRSAASLLAGEDSCS
jgi:hypothetical protein